VDEELRRLRRASLASGDEAARARLANALARAADPAKLALAVQLRQPEANLVRPCRRPRDELTSVWMRRFTRRLYRYGFLPPAIAAITYARFEERSPRLRYPYPARGEEAVAALEVWAAGGPSLGQGAELVSRFPEVAEADPLAVSSALRAVAALSCREAAELAGQAFQRIRRFRLRYDPHDYWVEDRWEDLYGQLRANLLRWAGDWSP